MIKTLHDINKKKYVAIDTQYLFLWMVWIHNWFTNPNSVREEYNLLNTLLSIFKNKSAIEIQKHSRWVPVDEENEYIDDDIILLKNKCHMRQVFDILNK